MDSTLSTNILESLILDSYQDLYSITESIMDIKKCENAYKIDMKSIMENNNTSLADGRTERYNNDKASLIDKAKKKISEFLKYIRDKVVEFYNVFINFLKKSINSDKKLISKYKDCKNITSVEGYKYSIDYVLKSLVIACNDFRELCTNKGIINESIIHEFRKTIIDSDTDLNKEEFESELYKTLRSGQNTTETITATVGEFCIALDYEKDIKSLYKLVAGSKSYFDPKYLNKILDYEITDDNLTKSLEILSELKNTVLFTLNACKNAINERNTMIRQAIIDGVKNEKESVAESYSNDEIEDIMESFTDVELLTEADTNNKNGFIEKAKLILKKISEFFKNLKDNIFKFIKNKFNEIKNKLKNIKNESNTSTQNSNTNKINISFSKEDIKKYSNEINKINKKNFIIFQQYGKLVEGVENRKLEETDELGNIRPTLKFPKFDKHVSSIDKHGKANITGDLAMIVGNLEVEILRFQNNLAGSEEEARIFSNNLETWLSKGYSEKTISLMVSILNKQQSHVKSMISDNINAIKLLSSLTDQISNTFTKTKSDIKESYLEYDQIEDILESFTDAEVLTEADDANNPAFIDKAKAILKKLLDFFRNLKDKVLSIFINKVEKLENDIKDHDNHQSSEKNNSNDKNHKDESDEDDDLDSYFHSYRNKKKTESNIDIRTISNYRYDIKQIQKYCEDTIRGYFELYRINDIEELQRYVEVYKLGKKEIKIPEIKKGKFNLDDDEVRKIKSELSLIISIIKQHLVFLKSQLDKTIKNIEKLNNSLNIEKSDNNIKLYKMKIQQCAYEKDFFVKMIDTFNTIYNNTTEISRNAIRESYDYNIGEDFDGLLESFNIDNEVVMESSNLKEKITKTLNKVIEFFKKLRDSIINFIKKNINLVKEKIKKSKARAIKINDMIDDKAKKDNSSKTNNEIDIDNDQKSGQKEIPTKDEKTILVSYSFDTIDFYDKFLQRDHIDILNKKLERIQRYTERNYILSNFNPDTYRDKLPKIFDKIEERNYIFDIDYPTSHEIGSRFVKREDIPKLFDHINKKIESYEKDMDKYKRLLEKYMLVDKRLLTELYNKSDESKEDDMVYTFTYHFIEAQYGILQNIVASYRNAISLMNKFITEINKDLSKAVNNMGVEESFISGLDEEEFIHESVLDEYDIDGVLESELGIEYFIVESYITNDIITEGVVDNIKDKFITVIEKVIKFLKSIKEKINRFIREKLKKGTKTEKIPSDECTISNEKLISSQLDEISSNVFLIEIINTMGIVDKVLMDILNITSKQHFTDLDELKKFNSVSHEIDITTIINKFEKILSKKSIPIEEVNIVKTNLMKIKKTLIEKFDGIDKNIDKMIRYNQELIKKMQYDNVDPEVIKNLVIITNTQQSLSDDYLTLLTIIVEFVDNVEKELNHNIHMESFVSVLDEEEFIYESVLDEDDTFVSVLDM